MLRGMTATTLISALTLGSAVLALWFHVRFPRLSPSELRAATVHFALSFGVVVLTPVAIARLLEHDPTVARAMVGLFALLLPALFYSFLSAIWLIRLFQHALPAR